MKPLHPLLLMPFLEAFVEPRQMVKASDWQQWVAELSVEQQEQPEPVKVGWEQERVATHQMLALSSSGV
jgi:hypothetical protein